MFGIRTPKGFKENLNFSYALIVILMILFMGTVSLGFMGNIFYNGSVNNIKQTCNLAMQSIKYEYAQLEQYALILSRTEWIQQIMTDAEINDKQSMYNKFTQMNKELSKLNYLGFGCMASVVLKTDNVDYEYGSFMTENVFAQKNNIDINELEDISIIYSQDKKGEMLYIRPVIDDVTSNRIGNIVVHYDMEQKLSKFADINLPNDGVFFITKENGEIICHHNKEYLFSNIKDEPYGDKILNTNKAINIRDGLKAYFCAVEIMPTTNWRAVSVISMDEFYRNLILYMVCLSVVCFVVVWIVLHISKKYVKNITYPLDTLCAAMKKAELVNIDKNKLFTEFEFMSERYNEMIYRINQQMKKIAEKEQEKTQADMRVLYEQINPHFLYNTLDSISWLSACSTDDEYSKKAIEMVSMLANMFRIGLSKGKEIILVADEIEHVKNYLGIQKHRYSDMFETEFDIEDDVLDCRIIKIILQPIVENSILHGFDGRESGGKILIKAYSLENTIRFTIEDNGCGADTYYINELMNKTPEKEKSGYGLYNIQTRIKLYYGEEYGIKASCIEKGGMRFDITIPRITGDSI